MMIMMMTMMVIRVMILSFAKQPVNVNLSTHKTQFIKVTRGRSVK